jgi:hypothetical protein
VTECLEARVLAAKTTCGDQADIIARSYLTSFLFDMTASLVRQIYGQFILARLKLRVHLPIWLSARRRRRQQEGEKQHLMQKSKTLLLHLMQRHEDGAFCYPGGPLLPLSMRALLAEIRMDLETPFMKRLTDPYPRHHWVFLHLLLSIFNGLVTAIRQAALQQLVLPLEPWPLPETLSVLDHLQLVYRHEFSSSSATNSPLVYMLEFFSDLLVSGAQRDSPIHVIRPLFQWSRASYQDKLKEYIYFCQRTTLSIIKELPSGFTSSSSSMAAVPERAALVVMDPKVTQVLQELQKAKEFSRKFQALLNNK